jgi:hypothetical protein
LDDPVILKALLKAEHGSGEGFHLLTTSQPEKKPYLCRQGLINFGDPKGI